MLEKQSMEIGTCPVNAVHETTACVPVSISPFAEPGQISVENCGAPVINCSGEPCCGTVNGQFEFTVSQKMRINVPIVFGADISVGEAHIQNGLTSGCLDGECSTCSCPECSDCCCKECDDCGCKECDDCDCKKCDDCGCKKCIKCID